MLRKKPWEVPFLFAPPDDSGIVPVGGGPGNSGGGGREQPDLPADPGQDSGRGEPGIRFIDEAFNQMSADEQEQGVIDARQQANQQQGQQPAQPAQPQYPQPVKPQGQQQAPQGQQTPQQLAEAQAAEIARQQAAQAAQPQPLTPEQQQQQQQELRARSDPFGMQAEMLATQEAAFVNALAEQVYPISPQEMDAFLAGDSKGVSQALARVHLNSVQSVMKVVSQQLPMMMAHYNKLYTAARDRENAFYDNNKFLDRKQHGPLVTSIARTYRSMYPNATDEQTDRAVGIMVAAAAGIQVPADHMQKVSPGAGKHQTANGVRTPGKVVRQTTDAFTPAGANGVGGAPRALDLGVWGEMSEIIQADERGAFDR